MKYFQPKTFLIIVAILFIHILSAPRVAFADVPFYGNLTDSTLDPTLTYTVDGEAVVAAGATLTIPAGTHLVFTSGSRIEVNGNLIIKGTAAKHVSIVGGTLASFIPVAQPLVTSRAFSIQSPEVQSPEVDSLSFSSSSDPDITSPEVTPLTVSNTVMLGDDATTAAAPKYLGFFFADGSTGTMTYTDISDGANGIVATQGSTISLKHTTFTNCDLGILEGGSGTLKIANTSFVNVPQPALLYFKANFTHSASSFTNTGIKGWQLTGDMLAGDTMKLNSTDGEYKIAETSVPQKAWLVISPGVTILTQDGQGIDVAGTLTASGTASNPITIYGDGVCPDHSPVINFMSSADAVIGHVNFHNLCNGMVVSHSTITLTNDSFDTIAGPVISSDSYGVVNASTITMHDVYQAFDMGIAGQLDLSDATITLVNSKDPAINMHDQVPLSGSHISIDGASTCIGIINNSSISAKNVTLDHCGVVALLSNDNKDGPSGITLTDSEIMNSGSALKLDGALVTNVSNDKFHDNTVGVSLTDMPSTTIINNWWGSNNGPTISSNPGGDGDSIVVNNVPNVFYRPWIGMAAPAVHNPVIIVPGITGSVLTKDYGDKSEIWPNLTELSLSPSDSFLDDLELLQSGTPSVDRPMTVGDIIRSVSATDIFGGMIGALEKNGYTEGTDLFVLPYDWRLSNTANQGLLKDAISNALAKSGKTKVNIIAHSMGGLLVQDYLAQNADAPIDHLFYIGVPHIGAPKAFQSLMFGDDMGFTFSIGPVKVPLLNADTVKTISQNMPSVYELLPSQKYIDTVGSYVSDLTQSATPLDLSATQQFMINDGRNKKMFPFAKTLHDATDALDTSAFSEYNFAGCGSTKTIGSYTITKKESLTVTGLQLVPEHRLYYTSGDGVVPARSAVADTSATDYYVASGSHGTLPAVSAIQSAINTILNGDTVDLTTGISDKFSSCSLSGEVVEIHSPATLDIYDDQGNHTGPTADGEIEYGIPNVDYEMINDEKFAFLPTGPTYKIIDHAEATGAYDMYISHSGEDDTITQEAYFNDVPMTTANAVGTVLIAPDQTTYSISMDQDGDGTGDSIIQPTALLDEAQAKDITPPVTTSSIVGNTVTLTATDDNAGVLNTKYSTDGTDWNIYTAPFQIVAGTTVQYLSMDNAGNVENIEQFVVPSATNNTNDNTNTSSDTNTTTANTQTTETAPVTVSGTGGNTYNYGGSTVINESGSTDTTTSQQSDTTPDNTDTTETDPTIDPQQTTPDTPDTPPTPDTTKPSVTPTPALSDPLSSNSSQTSTSDNDPSLIAMNDPVFDPAGKSSIATRLLTSAIGIVPIGNGSLLVVGVLIGCIILIVIIKKRFFSKHQKDRLE